MRGARFRREGLRGARLERTRLRRARVGRARVGRAGLQGARRRRARLRGRKAPGQAGTRTHRCRPHEGSGHGRYSRRSDRGRRRHRTDCAPPQQLVTPSPAHPPPR
ncbi:hypothetical protein ABZ636_39515 [Streptomyces sp. NPDC007251]|uniref:hypothetical protein n=1 Tax=Streptomyces sp. NPDC007251 TaxID=3154483 RepID=UPI0033F26BB0